MGPLFPESVDGYPAWLFTGCELVNPLSERGQTWAQEVQGTFPKTHSREISGGTRIFFLPRLYRAATHLPCDSSTKGYNSVVFSTCTKLCKQTHPLIPEHFITGERNSHSPFPLPRLWRPLICFLSLWPILDTYRWIIQISMWPFMTGFFHLADRF